MTTLTLNAAVPFAIFENAGLLYQYGDYREGGYLLTSSRSDGIEFISWDETWANNQGMHYDGRGTLAGPAYESVTLTDESSSQPFGMKSINLDTQWGIWGEIKVNFEGMTANGPVTYSVMLDTVEGMQTITLPDSFSSVFGVTWRAEGPSNILFDNIEVSRAPIVSVDKTVTVQEDSLAMALDIAAPVDPDGDSFTITVTGVTDAAMGTIQLADGSVVAVGDILAAEQLTGLTFTPTPDTYGAAGSFSYEVSDGIARNSQTVALDIAPGSQPQTTDVGLWASATSPGAPEAGAPHDAFWTHAIADHPWVTHTMAQVGGVTMETISLDAPWNTIKNVAVSNLASDDLTISGFVDVKIAADDGLDHSLQIVDAKRGDIDTGTGDDSVSVTYLSNEYHWSNLFTIDTGDGNDLVLVQPESAEAASQIRTPEPMVFNTDPHKTMVDIDTGAGADQVFLLEASGRVATGDGNDLIEVQSTGAPTNGESGFTWINAGSGQDVIAIAAGESAIQAIVEFAKGDSGPDALSGDSLSYGWSSGSTFVGGDLTDIEISLKGYAAGSNATLSSADAGHMLLTVTDAIDNHVDVINLYGQDLAGVGELELYWV